MKPNGQLLQYNLSNIMKEVSIIDLLNIGVKFRRNVIFLFLLNVTVIKY